jgi:SnoaL-like domain
MSTRAELLAAVEKSPAAAGARDRHAWVGLFTPGGQIEDPVGSRPHRGRHAIGRFYATFIGPRDITFHRDTDLVIGTTVVRDLELEVAMADSLVLRIPTYLRYDVENSADGLRIARLQAHWELPAMVMQFARSGPAAVPAGLALARTLLENQGTSGTAGFLSGFRGVGARGKRLLAELLDDVCAGDEIAVRRRLPVRVPVSLGDDQPLATSELVRLLAGGRPRKLIASGRTVAAGIETDGQRHVLIADLRPGPLTITRVRLFGPG